MTDSSVGVEIRVPMKRLLALGFLAALGFGLSSTAALADLKLCNKTDSRVGVALGYKDKEGWASEGWWNVGPNNCETLLKGPLIARYSYIFTIRGITDCESRGYQKTGFFEVDTGEETDWTISLSGEKTTSGTQTQ